MTNSYSSYQVSGVSRQKKIQSFRDLMIWQKSRKLVKQIYILSKAFPKSEIYGLTSQIRRCSVSVPSNIAEGFQRHSKKEYLQFLYISYGSLAELETQLVLARDLNYLTLKETELILENVVTIQKMINSLISKLKSSGR